jgi:hypothetical protein
MKNQNKVCLYIGTHNTTGLKYFGKTTRYFTQEDLQKYYHGSGEYWNNHLKIHKNNVTMELYGIYSLNENDEDYVKPIALKFSEDNDIVKALNENGERKGKKVWANQKPENGLDGSPKGIIFSEATKKKMSISARNKKPVSNITKKKLKNKVVVRNKLTGEIYQTSTNLLKESEYLEAESKGRKIKNTENFIKRSISNNSMAKEILIYNEKDQIMFKCFSNFKKILKENNLPKQLIESYRKNRILGDNKYSITKLKNSNQEKYIGWYARIKEKNETIG